MSVYSGLLLVLFIGVHSSWTIEQVDDPSVARPRKVTAEVVDNTIKLKWQAPRIAEDNCPVKRYLIRLRHDGGKRSKTWKIDGARYSLSLHDLQEDTLYYIRLMAVTCEGKGARTRWIKVKTNPYPTSSPSGPESQAPAKPTYVRTRTSSDSVILSWQPPEGNVIVRGYKVGYGEGVPDLNWRYVDASKRNVTIPNLKSGTQYVISLCGYNRAGEGKPEYELIYTRELNRATTTPFSPPENVRARILSESSAWLQWVDPSLGGHQQVTDDRYYNVHFQAVPNGKTLSMIVKALYVVLHDLTPGTLYEFKVRTVKEFHSSHFSDVARNRTFETKPHSPPRALTIERTNDSNTVQLAWRAPRQPNGFITGYLVLYSIDQKQPVSTWDILEVLGPDTHVLMSDLKSNTTYYFKVQAKNSKGYGPTSNTLAYTTSTAEDFDEDFTMSNEVISNGVAINGLDKIDSSKGPELNDESYIENVLPPMRKDTGKTIRSGSVQPFSSKTKDGSSNNNQYQADEIPPLDVTFQSVVKHTVSAVVNWKVPCSDNSPAKYAVRYWPAESPENYSDKFTPTNFVLLDNLSPNHIYKYKIRRAYKDGEESQWSKEGILDTEYPNGGS